MATVVLGCDSNGNDVACQDTVKGILEKAGHTVEKLPVSPTPFADYSYAKNGKNPKGKIGVYLMAGSLVSVADLHGGNTGFKYAYFGIRGDISPRFNSKEAFNTKIVNKDSDCTAICDKYSGRTYPQLNDMCKDKCQCVFGATPKELGEAILDAMGGGDGSDGGEGHTSRNGGGDAKGDTIHPNPTRGYHSSPTMGHSRSSSSNPTTNSEGIPSKSSTKGRTSTPNHSNHSTKARVRLLRELHPKCQTSR